MFSRCFAMLIATAAIASSAAAQPTPQGPHPDSQRFAHRVEAFAEADQQKMPDRCQILFLGSATIAIWKTLNEDMAPAHVIGRGLGNSHIGDQIYYFDKIVTPYHPRAIFFYTGENDVVDGQSPDEVIDNFKRFLALKDQKLGRTVPVYYISIKPSPARLSANAGQEKVNAMVQALVPERPDLHYVDIASQVWENNRPDTKLRDIYMPDGIHLNRPGYESVLIPAIKPLVMEVERQPNVCLGEKN